MNCKLMSKSCGTETKAKKLEILEGVGHWHCVEAADTIGPMIGDFAKNLV